MNDYIINDIHRASPIKSTANFKEDKKEDTDTILAIFTRRDGTMPYIINDSTVGAINLRGMIVEMSEL
jgi:hypothetical protein